MSDFSDATLLVTGASGPFARAAIEYLLANGAGKVIATTRDPGKVTDLAARGVEVRKADFNDPSTLGAAFAGADRLLLISTDVVDDKGTRTRQHLAAVAAAEAAGVRHVVYTSAVSPSPNPGMHVGNGHFFTEAALFASGMDWTILRDNLYTEVILWGAAAPLQSGQYFDATDGGGRNYVTREDAARTAAGALLRATGKSIHDVTGPAPVTQEAIAALLGEVAGKPIVRIGLTRQQLVEGLIGAGLPAATAEIYAQFDSDAANGFHAVTGSAVKEFSGSEPLSVAEFLRANRAALAA